jgi:uncharacterized protein (DUF1330 family)
MIDLPQLECQKTKKTLEMTVNKSSSLITDNAVLDWLSQHDLSKPVGMLNLLKFRPQAAYAADSGEAPCTGAEAYRRYGALATAILAPMGAKVILTGAVWLIGTQDEWDSAFVVRYERASDLINMSSDPAYLKIVHHRTAALADSRLLMMEFDGRGLD